MPWLLVRRGRHVFSAPQQVVLPSAAMDLFQRAWNFADCVLTPAAALAQVLAAKRIGVVAHFYMDPEVQGVLTSAAERWPHVHISDSLVMADSAVRMAEAGCKVLGAFLY